MWNEKPSVRLIRIALAIIAGTATMATYAQEENKAGEKVQRVEVTGSNIKRVDLEGVSPITIISREQILRSGATSVLDVMRNLTSAGGNGREFSDGNDFRNGASSASLRGMPTLILLNGNRLPVSGSDDSNGFTSVDLNSLPLAAIERIEVLKDGASAIYGTDAVGGVINFIMRSNYEGLELNASFGTTTSGGGDISKFSIAGGYGNRATDKYNLVYTFSAEDDKRIRCVDRDLANRFDFTNKPGGVQYPSVYGAGANGMGGAGTLSIGGNRFPDPECPKSSQLPYPSGAEWFPSPTRNGCLKSTAEFTDLVKPSRRYTGTLGANWDVAPDITVFATAFVTQYSKRIYGESSWLQNRSRGNLSVPASNPFNPYGKTVTFRANFPTEGGIDTDVTTSWLLGGVKGQLGGWDWSLTLAHADEDAKTVTLGSYKLDALNQAVEDGRYNPFGNNKNSAALIQELSGDMSVRSRSKTDSAKLQASSEFGQLPGGAIGVSVGSEFRKNTLSYTPSADWQNGVLAKYAVLPPISGSETLSAAYGELRLPILKTLEAQAALRYDHYELAGNTTNPKLGILWTPDKTFLLRANYSTGLVAPSLPQRFSSGRDVFYSVHDNRRCVEGDAYFDTYCSKQVKTTNTGSKNLQPEKSSQYNIGFVLEPIKDLSLGMTYFDIKWSNKIDVLDTQTVLDNEDGSYKSFVTRKAVTADDIAAYAALSAADRTRLGPLRGELTGLITGFVNRFESRTSGIDTDFAYTFRTANMGKIKIFGEATYTIKYDTVLLADNVYINCANNTSCDTGEYNNPRVLANLGVNWDQGPWSATVIANFVSGFKTDRSPGIVTNQWYNLYQNGGVVSPITTIDASASYSGWKNWVLRFGANNLFNRDPSFDATSSLGYNGAYGNPRGRYVYASAGYKFK